MTRKTIKSGPDEPLTDAELKRLVVAIGGERGGLILAKLGTHRIVGRLLADLTAARAELAERRAREDRVLALLLLVEAADRDLLNGRPAHDVTEERESALALAARVLGEGATS